MLSIAELSSWQDKFSMGLPFRKLLKVMHSLQLNIWMSHLSDTAILGSEVQSVRDLVLCDPVELWEQSKHDGSLYTDQCSCFGSYSYASRKPTLAAFKSQVAKHIGTFSTQQKVQDVWHRYGAVLQEGFGMHSAGESAVQNPYFCWIAWLPNTIALLICTLIGA